MGFAEELVRLSQQILDRKQHCDGNEEATKQALVLPFFQLLGYDIYNPKELVPEYKAGFVANKEKIDYAIFIEEKPVFLVEAKAIGKPLENYDAQLAKYFNSTPNMKVAIITDGVLYKFFTDLKQANLMDGEAFFEFNITDYTDDKLSIIQNFRRDRFNLENVITQAEDLVYLHAINAKFRQLFKNPTEDFIRFIAGDIYPRRMTPNAIDRLRPLVKQSMSSTLVSMVSQGLTQEITKIEEPQEIHQEDVPTKSEPLIVTTEEELNAYNEIAKVIKNEFGESSPLDYKDTQSYFVVHAGKVTRWFCRLHFRSYRYLTFRLSLEKARMLTSKDVIEHHDGARIDIADISEIASLSELLITAYRDVAGV